MREGIKKGRKKERKKERGKKGGGGKGHAMGAGFEGLQGLNDEEWGPESRLHSRVDKSRDPITNHLSATWRPIIGQPRHAHAWDATRA